MTHERQDDVYSIPTGRVRTGLRARPLPGRVRPGGAGVAPAAQRVARSGLVPEPAGQVAQAGATSQVRPLAEQQQ